MTSRLYKYLISTIYLACIMLSSQFGYGQLLPRYDQSPKEIEVMPPQLSETRSENQFKLSSEMKSVVDFSRTNPSITERNYTIDNFLNRYFPYFETRLMRNGDIAYLKFYYEKYLRTLAEYTESVTPDSLTYDDRRGHVFKKLSGLTRKEKRQFWREFKKKKKELWVNYYSFKQYVISALSTEISMILQEQHLPTLTYSMNQLENLDGTALHVNIYSNQILSIPSKKNATIAGLSIISKCDDVFTSGSPAVREAYPGLRGSNKGLTVHLRFFEDGVTLSHELGHLYYLYHKWDEYVDYIQLKGKDYEPGGHGPDDPSGLAAKMTEEGKMPF